VTIAVELPPDLLARLEARARERGLTLADYLAKLIDEAVPTEPNAQAASLLESPPALNRGQGMYAHAGIRVPDDFDAPLPEDVLRAFEGDAGSEHRG
jgi:hypothetical protein